uniref:Uncharacterized protein n=1 Tax=Panagrolaimus sp. PS1159 TaxID=55785 RepID=A0AC35FEC4_9BILA
MSLLSTLAPILSLPNDTTTRILASTLATKKLGILNAILTSTLPNLVTTEGPSFIAEYGLMLLIAAGIIIVILLMMLFICCATRSSSSSGTGRNQSVLPTYATPPSTETTVTRQQESAIYADQKGQPILKTYKVTTRSTSSNQSNRSMQSRGKLLPSKQHHRNQKRQNSTFPLDTAQPKHKTAAARQVHSQY